MLLFPIISQNGHFAFLNVKGVKNRPANEPLKIYNFDTCLHVYNKSRNIYMSDIFTYIYLYIPLNCIHALEG